MRSRRVRARGLTLLELLVALSVLALTVTLLFEGLRFGFHLWGSSRVRADAGDAVATTRRFLQARIEALEPFRMAREGEAIRPVIGTRESVEFTAPPPAAVGAGSFRYRVRLRTTEGRRELIAAWRRDWDGAVDRVAGPEWREEILLGDVASVDFQYLAFDEKNSGAWRSEWTETKAPKAIRITLRFGANASRSWPPLTVARQIDDDPLCEFDSVSRACRS